MTSPAPAPARVVRLAGELTIQTAAETKAAVMAALDDCTGLDIDLSELTELDTAGLQILLLARREALQLGINLTLSGPPPPVRDIFRAVGLDIDLTPEPVRNLDQPLADAQKAEAGDVHG